ncbi:hypothetical protein QKL05_gp1 [TTV-like mini virus]|uniref:Uncharacterized protein n=1 Tax=TTV-like mini virus TaxID=93678 RepID=V5NSF8_9VIRU|nr:hypothetical protein QKL05_gp1 [TTV-like mini virus]AHA91749.1 hypothetical protein [TTV-like mini virus]AHA91752.1 hypothetical protein [TTV-like mini virus]
MSMPFSTKKQRLQLCNLVTGIHDITCNCYNPLFHSAQIILKQLAPELKKEEKHQLKQCLTEETTTKEEEDVGFTTGDLEALFAENGDDTEDAAG